VHLPSEELANPRAAGLGRLRSNGCGEARIGNGTVVLASCRAPSRMDRQLVQWVTEGISLSSSPFEQFQRGNQLYVFSTLRLTINQVIHCGSPDRSYGVELAGDPASWEEALRSFASARRSGLSLGAD